MRALIQSGALCVYRCVPRSNEKSVLQHTAVTIQWAEKGLLPDLVVRMGVRRLIRARLAELQSGDAEATARRTQAFVDAMRDAELAPMPQRANEQHYELPAEFFCAVLGPQRKYSSCYWSAGVDRLDAAEAAALTQTCERAGLADGQQVLELGCGWGSLTLSMARHYPSSRITALSNSHSQRRYVEGLARQLGLDNVRVFTRDINAFDTEECFDRVVSVEMFEHLRNWPHVFANVARWLRPDGRFFLHVFAHREAPYAFVERDASDWMSRHFFSGGMMPSDDLALHCQDRLRVLQRWRWDGTHYQRTAQAWLNNMDAHRDSLWPLFERTWGEQAGLWWSRWRIFFLSVAELFGHDAGRQWWVSHYLFEPRS